MTFIQVILLLELYIDMLLVLNIDILNIYFGEPHITSSNITLTDILVIINTNWKHLQNTNLPWQTLFYFMNFH